MTAVDDPGTPTWEGIHAAQTHLAGLGHAAEQANGRREVSDDEIADLAIAAIRADQDLKDGWIDEPPPESDLPEAPGATATGEEVPLFVDVAAVLSGGLPEAPPPVLLRRTDGHCLLYAAKVNVLFGDPECGKTWIALAAIVEALADDRRAAIIDLDHNGAAEILSRLLMLGARPDVLSDPNRFRLAEPEDEDNLVLTVAALRMFRPAVALVDSLGELLPLFGLNSSNPDDYTVAHRRVLTPLANAGAAVVAIDHLPKSDDARVHGQTGTLAKRRAVNGVTLRVRVHETFAPGRGGAANLTVEKDRSGGVRAHCPGAGKSAPAGRFVLSAWPDGTLTWAVTGPPRDDGIESAPDPDVALLDQLDPPPRSQRDVKERMGWGGSRAMSALRRWREQQKHATDEADPMPEPDPMLPLPT
ncbi:hypothetical protein RB614_19735 [Phytohabitans sp. ZYX-F-186]|uniref:AAA+ ATPase domain-containing protein n=1 Tax=Phytohabitans maris TaxID=3071409 RepID=A0ABU0ZI68_9ACTN|nr:hypothetical protein [Phytohabitans sp. ZYX-F-186]MDQ7906751.1 hypothetical protein [Phytohabitans sp. ZYX-F-186]